MHQDSRSTLRTCSVRHVDMLRTCSVRHGDMPFVFHDKNILPLLSRAQGQWRFIQILK